jgi:endonuclease/exonuclease/phosphatase family metal-dependent hydrolase
LLKVKVVTFNILSGAGIDPQWDDSLPSNLQGIDRSPLLIDYLGKLSADIIGLQEVTDWDKGSPPFIKTVADQLGLNYFITAGRADSALLTKYEILEAEDISDDFNSMIRARLLGPDGEPINVFVVHLDSTSEEHRSCGTEVILQKVQPYLAQRTILMGDMNFTTDSQEWSSDTLTALGWRVAAIDSHFRIDHIWMAPSMQWDTTGWTAQISQDARRISDHWPIGKEFQIYSPSLALLPVPTATPLPPIMDLPSAVTDVVVHPQIAFVEKTENSICHAQGWESGWVNESYIKGQLRLFGKKDWQSGSNWSKPLAPNGGILLDFKYSTGSQFDIYLEHSTWAQPEYRRFGLYTAKDVFQSDMWKGQTPLGGDAWDMAVQPKPDTWYRLLLTADQNAQLTAFLWEAADPSQVVIFRKTMDADWTNLQWRLAAGANQGRVFIQGVTQVVFDAIK